MSIYLGSNIKYLRKKNAVKQSAIAPLVNKGLTTIGHWENGKANPNIVEISIIANYFKVSLDDLILKDLSKTSPAEYDSSYVSEPLNVYGEHRKPAVKHDAFDGSKDAVIQAQKVTIEALQTAVETSKKALQLAEEQIEFLKKSPF